MMKNTAFGKRLPLKKRSIKKFNTLNNHSVLKSQQEKGKHDRFSNLIE